MSTNALATTNGHNAGDIMERVIAVGDLSKLQPEELVLYYNLTCESLGLNPLTRPFEYITLNGKLTLYARKDCTDQLRSLKRVSVAIVDRQRIEDIYAVTARATMPDGRTDESIGAVSIGGLKGDNLANALMKAETKAKRRVTLSICGLGMLDETELETIPAGARSEPPHNHEQAGAMAQGIAAAVTGTPSALPAPEQTGRPVCKGTLSLVAKMAKRLMEEGIATKESLLEDVRHYGVERLESLTQADAMDLLETWEAALPAETTEPPLTEGDRQMQTALAE